MCQRLHILGVIFSVIFSSDFLAMYIRMLEEAISSSFPDHFISKDNHLIIILLGDHGPQYQSVTFGTK